MSGEIPGEILKLIIVIKLVYNYFEVDEKQNTV